MVFPANILGVSEGSHDLKALDPLFAEAFIIKDTGCFLEIGKGKECLYYYHLDGL